MIDFRQLAEQTGVVRAAVAGVLRSMDGRADVIPPGWKNNARWHAGHLVLVPRLLSLGLSGRPLGVADDYRRWFAKDTGPASWAPDDAVPSFEYLVDELAATTGELFAAFESREDEPFATPYLTLIGATLRTPAEGLSFSMVHDGIHLGMLLALRRDLATAGAALQG